MCERMFGAVACNVFGTVAFDDQIIIVATLVSQQHAWLCSQVWMQVHRNKQGTHPRLQRTNQLSFLTWPAQQVNQPVKLSQPINSRRKSTNLVEQSTNQPSQTTPRQPINNASQSTKPNQPECVMQVYMRERNARAAQQQGQRDGHAGGFCA